MKKVLGYTMVAIGILLGVPGVLVSFTIVGLPIGIPMVLVGAAVAIVGLHLAGHDTDVVTRKRRNHA